MAFDEVLRSYNELHPEARVETRRAKDGALVIALACDLEMKAAGEIAPLVEAALVECPARGRLLLDLHGVGYVASTGVGLLANTMVAAGKRSISFVLLDIPPRVSAIMDTLGLLSFFNVETSGD
jgi:anti-anti-sigma factor